MITLTSIKSALVSTLLMAVLTVGTYIVSVGDVFNLNYHTITNLFVLSLVTGIVSLLKSILTDESGTFAGIVQVK